MNINYVKKLYADGARPDDLFRKIIKKSEEYKDWNIWITPPSEKLIKPYLDRLESIDKSLPLWGIPFAIKDNIDLGGVPTTAGCPEYAYTPAKSAFVVQRLIDNGAIPIGKTNLDQFATGLVGVRSPYGECHNARQPEMISGGSSSGSAVSVASGLAAFSLGTDTAGSGRVPAMLNTLVGFKPSCGAWSTRGVVPACESLDCVTVFANSIEDAKAVDSVARGYDTDCAWSKEIIRGQNKIPEKIFLPEKEPEFFADGYKEKWYKALSQIKDLGITVESIDTQMFSDAASILYDGAYVAERWNALGEFVESHPGATFPVTEKILRSGITDDKTASRLFDDLHSLAMYRHRTRELLKDAVLVMPTAGGSFTRAEVDNDPIATNSKMGLYTNHCNLLDLCAIEVPQDAGDHDHPFGITAFSLSDQENLIMGFADRFMKVE